MKQEIRYCAPRIGKYLVDLCRGRTPPRQSPNSFKRCIGIEALENALGGGIVAIDLSLPDNRQLPAARNERVRARAHSEPLAELAVLVRYRAHDLLMCGGTHDRTSDENGMQAKSDQDGDEQGVRE